MGGETADGVAVGLLGTATNNHRKPHKFLASWFSPVSYILFLWFSPLLRLGYRRSLEYEDLVDIPDALKTAAVYPAFSRLFSGAVAAAAAGGAAGARTLERARAGLTSRLLLATIWRAHRPRILAALAMQLCYSGVLFVGPQMLNRIVRFLTDVQQDDTTGSDTVSSGDVTNAYLYALGMLLAPLFGALAAAQANRLAVGTGAMIRAELTAAIYRKALSLSTRARQGAETGRVVNLMSSDVSQLQSFFYPFASQLLTGPAVLVTSLVLLWFQIRWATFIGLAILMASTPATSIFVRRLTQYRREMLRHADQRIKLMNQLLVGIRVLKMYAWEAAQQAAVLDVRREELGWLRRAIPMRVGMQTLLFAAPSLAMVAAFAAYGSAEPDDFTPAAIFTSIALFSLMRFPLIFLPFALVQLSNALVSMRRLTAFFMLEERGDDAEDLGAPGILIEGGTFVWAAPQKPAPGDAPKASGRADRKAQKEAAAAEKKKQEEEEKEAADKAAADGAAPDAVAVKLSGMEGAADGEAGGAGETANGAAGGADKADGKAANGAAGGAAPAAKGEFWLRDVDLRVSPGELVCVVGRVGSGKSSLVSAVLGEMERSAGRLARGGALAYAAQQAWIANATLRDNVTFGRPFDAARWDAAVEACCLAADLAVLPAGADTEIGEKGINLSGGQKQRVSLARALYADADVYVLDDPLSAVDVHVGQHIFEKFITGAIAGKARLLVTNQLQYLPAADRVVVLDAGRVVAAGTYEECQANEVFARLLRETAGQAGALEAADAAGAAPPAAAAPPPAAAPAPAPAPAPERSDTAALDRRAAAEAAAAAPGVAARSGAMFQRSETMAAPQRQAAAGKAASGRFGRQLQRFETMAAENKKAAARRAGGASSSKKPGFNQRKRAPPERLGSLIAREGRAEGAVTGRVYGRYVAAYGLLSFASLVVLWSGEQAVRILTNWWLSNWAAAELTAQFDPASSFSRTYYIGGYLGLALGFVGLTLVRSTTNLYSAARASRVIHARTLGALVRAPVAFFDTTPVGRVLNRFSKDTDEVDFLLSMSMTEFGNCIMQLTATLVFIAIVQPWILVGVAPLAGVYYLLQKYFRRSNIELQRLDAVSRSPVYAHFSESLAGVDTIRAYRLADAFAAASDARVDANHRAYFCVRMASEWLAMRLDMVGAAIVFGTAVLSIANRGSISASLAALTLSEALDVTVFLKAAVTSGAMFETRFNAVERLVEYWELEQEAPAESAPDKRPPPEWPHAGEVEYRGVWMRYRPGLDAVLRGVSFRVAPGDKVGIVGRTGSGKSSLIVALFRLVEPSAGAILLDGRDVLGLGLDDLRSRVAVIPQDPVLFSGAVRSNLDPYGRHADAELWDALGHVALKDAVAALGEGLGARVAEGGDNFSVGQRQLLCVARALLRRPRVLVADEATASVDPETDALIQRTIRAEFAGATVLTIAHRLATVLDSTKVLVMQDGVVGEYDTVPRLLGRADSSFRAMVAQAGLESPAASRGASRSASAADLAGAGADAAAGAPPAGGAPRGPPARGFNTFVARMKDVGLKE